MEYVGGYDDYLRQSRTAASGNVSSEPDVRSGSHGETSRPRKLTFNEQRELEALPARIAALEEEQGRLKDEAASPQFYKSPADHIHAVLDRIDLAHKEHDEAVARWLELEELR